VVGCSASASVLRRSLQCSGFQDAARPQVRLIPPCFASLPIPLVLHSCPMSCIFGLPTLLTLHLCLHPYPCISTENAIYVFPEMKLRGLVTNSYIYVSVGDLHIPGSVCLYGASKLGRPILGIFNSQTSLVLLGSFSLP
jgi:hypothetical protein